MANSLKGWKVDESGENLAVFSNDGCIYKIKLNLICESLGMIDVAVRIFDIFQKA